MSKPSSATLSGTPSAPPPAASNNIMTDPVNVLPLSPQQPKAISAKEEHARKVRALLNTRNTGSQGATSAPAPIDPRADVAGFGQLHVDQINLYDRNPREATNPIYLELKESIRAAGFQGTLSVTRRPGDALYMVSAGGNTRLQILKELFEETGDARFAEVYVLHEVYQNESTLLSKHLAENEIRGDTTFWEKARGLMTLRQLLEEEQKCTLSQRQFTEQLRRMGLSQSPSAINYYQFAVERLTTLGGFLNQLKRDHLKEHLQPLFSQLVDLAQLYGIDEVALMERVINPATHAYAATFVSDTPFDVTTLCAAWRRQLGDVLELSEGQIDRALALRQAFPVLDASEIRQRVTRQEVPPQLKKTEGRGPVGNADQHPATSTRGPTLEAMLDYIAGLAAQLARQSGITDLLVVNRQMPSGFYVELPATPISDDLRNEYGTVVPWWLLASLSWQLIDIFSELMPASSRWRNARLPDVSGASLESCYAAIRVAVGPAPDAETMMVALMNPRDPLFPVFHALQDAVWQLRCQYPHRHTPAFLEAHEGTAS